MDKTYNWRKVDHGKSGFKPIEIEFINFFSSYGIRMRGTNTYDDNFRMV